MSTIGPDSRIDRTSLDGQAALESLRGREPAPQEQIQQSPQVAEAALPAYAPPAADAGETVLNADAWSAVPEGERRLAGDPGFEHELGGLDLSSAADRGADAVLDALS